MLLFRAQQQGILLLKLALGYYFLSERLASYQMWSTYLLRNIMPCFYFSKMKHIDVFSSFFKKNYLKMGPLFSLGTLL